MNTLYSKLALVFGVLLAAIGLAYAVLSQNVTQRYLEQANQRLNRDLARNLVADQALVNDGRLDQQALKETFDRYMAINPSIEIYLLDLDGAILAYSADPGVVKRKTVALKPIRRFLAGDDSSPVLGDDPRSHDQRKIFSVTPVPSASAPEGYLYVVLRGEIHDSILQLYRDSLLLRLSAWVLGGSLLVGLLVGLISFDLLTRRLRHLTRLMDGFRRSRFQRYIPYHGRAANGRAANGRGASGDEIEQLGVTFDQMAERMQSLLAEVSQRDALRRELVSNISHDLRTPLTCLHGYLETLKLKGERLSAKERRIYLDAALGHSNQLGKLIGELFELAKLEAQAVQPKIEPFAPAELLHDIAQKFKPSASERNIQLEVACPSNVPFAAADIGLIERVLENLIGNALFHTPSGGRIGIELNYHNGRLTLAVSDTGQGIEPTELAHVFDRFYRSPRHAETGSQHLGLGLAIAKRIVELHRSELTVTSRPRQGTRFMFQLPVWQTG